MHAHQCKGSASRLCCLPTHSLFRGLPSLSVQELAHKLAMQVVGASPKYLDRSAVPSEALQAESAVLREQALKSGAQLLHCSGGCGVLHC